MLLLVSIARAPVSALRMHLWLTLTQSPRAAEKNIYTRVASPRRTFGSPVRARLDWTQCRGAVSTHVLAVAAVACEGRLEWDRITANVVTSGRPILTHSPSPRPPPHTASNLSSYQSNRPIDPNYQQRKLAPFLPPFLLHFFSPLPPSFFYIHLASRQERIPLSAESPNTENRPQYPFFYPPPHRP